MARLNITLPDYIAEKLDEEAKRLDVAHSTLIAHLKQVEKLIAEHEAEMQQVRDAYVEQVQQIKADSAARTQHVEEELQRLETLTRLQPPTAEPEPQPTAEPELQPTVEPEPQPTAEPSPSVHPVSDTDVRPSHPIKKLEDLGPIIDHRPRVDLQPPTAEPEPQPTAEPEPQPTAEPELQPTVEPEPQPTAEPSPSVHPVSDTDVRSSRPRGGTLNVPTDVEPSPIEPSSKVAVTKDTDMRSMEETHRVIGKDDRIVLESGLFKSRAPREKQA
ncbi:MAG: hypothetical protein WAL97_05745 [Halobacteriota archaeon]